MSKNVFGRLIVLLHERQKYGCEQANGVKTITCLQYRAHIADYEVVSELGAPWSEQGAEQSGPGMAWSARNAVERGGFKQKRVVGKALDNGWDRLH